MYCNSINHMSANIIIQCKQDAYGSVDLDPINHHAWMNTFDEGLQVKKGDMLRINQAFVNSQTGGTLMEINSSNNTFNMTVSFYVMRNGSGNVDYLIYDVYFPDGFTLYTEEVTTTIPNGFYDMNQIGLILQKSLTESASMQIANVGDTGWNIVRTNTFRTFTATDARLINRNGDEDYPWPTTGGENYVIAGANMPVFEWNRSGNSRFTWSFLHQPFYGADGQPSCQINRYGDYPVYTSLSGVNLTLDFNVAGSGWAALGFDEATQTNLGETEGQIVSSAYTAIAAPPETLTVQADSTTIQALTLPLLSTSPYWILQTDLSDESNLLMPDTHGFVNCSGILNQSEYAQDYSLSYQNSFNLRINEDKVIKSIRSRILTSGAQVPTSLLPRSSIIYELIPAPVPGI